MQIQCKIVRIKGGNEHKKPKLYETKEVKLEDQVKNVLLPWIEFTMRNITSLSIIVGWLNT